MFTFVSMYTATPESVLIYAEISTFGLINYLTMIYRADSFMEAYRQCDRMEKFMTQIGVPLDFAICRWTILILYIIVFSAYSSLFILFSISDKSFNIFVWEIFIMGIPVNLMTVPMFNLLSLGSLLYSRFKALNKLIEDQLCINSRRIDVQIDRIAQLHSNICQSCNNLIYANEYVLLTYYLFTFVQVGEFVLNLMGYYRSRLEYNVFVWNVLFTLTNLAALIMMTLLKYESTLTGPALCELTEAYFDEEMNEQV